MLKSFLKADEVRVALVAGFCIISLSVIFKRVLHVESDSALTNSPSYFVILYLFTRVGKAREKAGGWILWSSIIVGFSIIAVIAKIV